METDQEPQAVQDRQMGQEAQPDQDRQMGQEAQPDQEARMNPDTQPNPGTRPGPEDSDRFNDSEKKPEDTMWSHPGNDRNQ